MHIDRSFYRRSNSLTIRTKNPKNVDAIIFINASSTRIPDKDLEKHLTTREIAISEGMNALAQWIRHENIVTEKAFHDKKKWQLFKEIFTKTSVEGFVAATNALHTMPEDVTTSLKSTECKLFGIVGSEDDVFRNLMNEMKKEISRFEFTVIEQSDHWMIVENPVALDEALDVLLNNIKYR